MPDTLGTIINYVIDNTCGPNFGIGTHLPAGDKIKLLTDLFHNKQYEGYDPALLDLALILMHCFDTKFDNDYAHRDPAFVPNFLHLIQNSIQNYSSPLYFCGKFPIYPVKPTRNVNPGDTERMSVLNITSPALIPIAINGDMWRHHFVLAHVIPDSSSQYKIFLLDSTGNGMGYGWFGGVCDEVSRMFTINGSPILPSEVCAINLGVQDSVTFLGQSDKKCGLYTIILAYFIANLDPTKFEVGRTPKLLKDEMKLICNIVKKLDAGIVMETMLLPSNHETMFNPSCLPGISSIETTLYDKLSVTGKIRLGRLLFEYYYPRPYPVQQAPAPYAPSPNQGSRPAEDGFDMGE